MAQDPEHDEEQQDEEVIDPSHELDMVALYTSLGVDAEMEAEMIHGLLESSGVPSMVVRAAQYPALGIEVQVPASRLEEAKRLIEEAQSAGPEAAAEAEAESEK